MNNKFLITILSANSAINHNKKNNNKAFSLIELSIVLIIMGLLVAGVMGGSSLIWSAKIRSTVQEYYEYKTAYNAYYTQYGKVPGEDPDNKGFILGTTAFKDLKEKGFIKNKIIELNNHNPSVYVINSKLGNRVVWSLDGNYDVCKKTFKDSNNGKINTIQLGNDYSTPENSIFKGQPTQRMNYKEAVAIESKIDDGKANTGNVISYNQSTHICGDFGTDENLKNSIELWFRMDF